MNQKPNKVVSAYPQMSDRLKKRLAEASPEERKMMVASAMLMLRYRKQGAKTLKQAVEMSNAYFNEKMKKAQ